MIGDILCQSYSRQLRAGNADCKDPYIALRGHQGVVEPSTNDHKLEKFKQVQMNCQQRERIGESVGTDF